MLLAIAAIYYYAPDIMRGAARDAAAFSPCYVLPDDAAMLQPCYFSYATLVAIMMMLIFCRDTGALRERYIAYAPRHVDYGAEEFRVRHAHTCI